MYMYIDTGFAHRCNLNIATASSQLLQADYTVYSYTVELVNYEAQDWKPHTLGNFLDSFQCIRLANCAM